MRALRIALAAIAFVVPAYFLVTRAHDHYRVREQLECIRVGLDARGLVEDVTTDARVLDVYASCGTYEKKFLYSDDVWGSNKLAHPMHREDLAEFLWSLLAIVPCAIVELSTRAMRPRIAP